MAFIKEGTILSYVSLIRKQTRVSINMSEVIISVVLLMNSISRNMKKRNMVKAYYLYIMNFLKYHLRRSLYIFLNHSLSYIGSGRSLTRAAII